MNFRFENPSAFQYLYITIAIFLITLFIWAKRKKQLDAALNQRLRPFLLSSLSTKKRKLKLILEVLVLSLSILALARPQLGESQQKIKSEGIELMIALDVSKSMLVEDIKPSRLEHAKNEITRLLESLSGDKVGLIAFAGSSVVLAPLTSDYSTLRLFLDTAGPDSVTTGGTNFKSAIDAALGAVERGGIDPDEGKAVTKVLLIVSDGESTTGDSIESARKAANRGVRIFTLGLGTRAGAPIPERDEFGNLKGYKKQNGQAVLSSANEEALSSLSSAGSGAFYFSDFSGQAVNLIKKDIEKMQKAEFDNDITANYDEQFQIILLLAVLLGLLEFALGERKTMSKFWRGRFDLLPVYLIFFSSQLYASNVSSTLDNNKAVKKLESQSSAEAYQILSERLVNDPDEAALHYNLGHIYESNEEKEQALKAYISAAKKTEDQDLKFRSLFNAARLFGSLDKKAQALDYYQQALVIRPDSEEVKINIELLMKNEGQGSGGKDGKEQNKDQNKDGESDKDKKDDNNENDPKNNQDRTNEPKTKPTPRPFNSKELSQQDAKKIMDELKRQEEQIRAKFNEKYRKESPVDKDW